MKRTRTVLLIGLLVGLLASVVGAVGQDSPTGFRAEFGAETTFLPDFALDTWIDLNWDLDAFSFGSLTDLAFFPAFVASETLSVGYALDPLGFLALLGVDIYPFSFADLSLSATAGLIDVKSENLAFTIDAELLLTALPAFALTFSLDFDLDVWVFGFWVDADLDILTIAFDVLVGGQAHVLDLTWDEGGLSAFLGASSILLPGLDARAWFDVIFDSGGFELRSDTDIGLTPFSLIEQSLRLTILIGGLEIYAWGGFLGDLTFSAGIGFTYQLPSAANAD